MFSDNWTGRCANKTSRYNGYKNTTYSGKECKNWTSPRSFLDDRKDQQFIIKEWLDDNYCRDPFNNGYVWCYTGETNAEWEPCDITGKYVK
jgi:hypothetical protein